MTTLHATVEERLALIEEVLAADGCRFPFCTSDDDAISCADDECGCHDGDDDGQDEEDAQEPSDEEIANAAVDGTLQALQSLISIAANGSEEDALAASRALLDYGLMVGVA